MRDAFIAIEQQLLPNLASDYAEGETFQGWIKRGDYNLDGSSTDTEVLLTDASYRRLTEFLGADYSRFLFSCVESFREATRTSNPAKAVSWRLVALYYSAYYGAQSICRGSGEFLTRLETPEVRWLADLGSALGVPISLTKGHYRVSLDVKPYDRVNIKLSKTDERREGGAHEAFWSFFDHYLSTVAQRAVGRNLGNASAVVSDVDLLQRSLRSNGHPKGNYLSMMRNSITYRHEHGGWFPYRIAGTDLDELNRLAVCDCWTIRTDADARVNALASYLHTSAILANFAIQIAAAIGGGGGAGTFKRRLARVMQGKA